jgi:TnpA family transposase
MEHDSPTLLFNLAAEYLISAKTIRPGVVILGKLVASARTGARALTWEKVVHLLTGQLRDDLDRLLMADAGLAVTRLAWLTTPAVDATAAAVKTAIEKLTYLRNMGAHTLDLSMLPTERRRFLATVARRSTSQALQRRDGDRRYPILLALVAQSAVDQLDEVVGLFDQAVSARESRARSKTDEALIERAKKGEARHLLMDVILPVLADPSIPDEEAGSLLRSSIGMSKLQEVVSGGWRPLPRDHGQLSTMDSSYSYLRQFTPDVLSAIDFQGELDRRTRFLDCFVHAGGRKQARSAELKRSILAVLIAMATNLGLARMSEACGVPYDVLAWTAEWYVREETLREANTCIVNHHHSLELAGVFGGGTMSSSDGQRFPVRGKSLTGREMTVFGGQVLSTYTHVSDQHSTFGTKVIVATTREAQYTLDDFLGNATDLPIYEHATDTHGVTLINFALFDLVGKVLSPRIRDLGRITLIRDGTPAEIARLYPHAGPLLGARWNEDLVEACWPDLLRMAGSLKYGQATGSLVVGKWSAASRQNTLAAALKEWGTLRRTIHAARYLSDPAYRRKIGRQLNKGESLHALRRDLHYAHQGTVGKPHLADQSEQAWCLTVLTNSVITWTTEYYQLAVQQLRGQGRDVPGEILAHISPAHSENVNFFGVITVDVEAELAKLDPAGWRPLRPAAPDLSLLL